MSDTLLIDAAGRPPLPWLAEPLAQALQGHRGHALLAHAAPGDGALAFAFSLVMSWLCEDRPTPASLACGRCGSCHLVQAHAHPDLTVLLPETLRRELEWPLPDDKTESDRKPSKQVRVNDVRLLIDRVTRTSARGRGKAGMIFPAETMNAQAANALLKTLEEPAGGTRLLVSAAEPARLLPTVRSRCQALRLASPSRTMAAAWLAEQGIADGVEVLLSACSGRPLDALALFRAGVDARAWAALPGAVLQGHAGALAGWPVQRVLDALAKLCHDAMAMAGGGAPRYFPPERALARAQLPRLAAWSRDLARWMRHAEHPWNEGLLLEALVKSGADALRPKATAARG